MLNRLFLHLAAKVKDVERIKFYKRLLGNGPCITDEICVASYMALENRYHDARDLLKELLVNKRLQSYTNFVGMVKIFLLGCCYIPEYLRLLVVV